MRKKKNSMICGTDSETSQSSRKYRKLFYSKLSKDDIGGNGFVLSSVFFCLRSCHLIDVKFLILHVYYVDHYILCDKIYH